MGLVRIIAILRAVAAGGAFIASAAPASAADATLAVAANFKAAMTRLEPAFEAQSGHDLAVAYGATGKFYAQIVNGAPFDALLAADAERPARLETSGDAVAGSRFTYAIGRLVLWSPDPDRIGADGEAVLRAGEFRRLAIANPALAPYGAAASDVIAALGVEAGLQDRIVMGENVGQAFALVASGGAELGFVALSQVKAAGQGSWWAPPSSLHAPIRQDAVLLAHGEGNDAARAFLAFLVSDQARAIIADAGYEFAP